MLNSSFLCHRSGYLPQFPHNSQTHKVPLSSPRCSSSSDASSSSPNAASTAKPKNRMIDYSSPDEGWIRFDTDKDMTPEQAKEEEQKAEQNYKKLEAGLDETIADLIAQVAGTHYEFLGIAPEAGSDEIKSAYRKLSKQYHPDSTALPIEVAEKKFFRLKEAYNVLSSEADRKLYDWHLAQEASKERGGRFIWPYEVDRSQRREGGKSPRWKTEWQPKPHPVEILGAKNLKLSDQQQTALAFDLFAIAVSIVTMIYVGIFKNHT